MVQLHTVDNLNVRILQFRYLNHRWPYYLLELLNHRCPLKVPWSSMSQQILWLQKSEIKIASLLKYHFGTWWVRVCLYVGVQPSFVFHSSWFRVLDRGNCQDLVTCPDSRQNQQKRLIWFWLLITRTHLSRISSFYDFRLFTSLFRKQYIRRSCALHSN